MSAPPPRVFYVNCGLLLSALELCAHVSLSNQLQCLFYFLSSTLEGNILGLWVEITFSNIVKYGGFEVVQAAEVVAAFRQVGTHVYLG